MPACLQNYRLVSRAVASFEHLMQISVIKKIFGSKNDRELKRMAQTVDAINALSETIGHLSDAEIATYTSALQKRYGDGETLDSLLPEAFALVRESADRANDTRHFDVQLLGGIALHEGKISEMRTGEGKTLMSTLAAYLNALSGRSVHIVTVNDYLARRDAEWMGPIYRLLGLSVGVIQSRQPFAEKQEAYRADITYGTNNEFGFDYLRDNMAFRMQDRVQRERYFAIVDEVDSILIDEARTPLIISGPAEDSTKLYELIDKIAPKLVQQDKVESTLPSMLGGEQVEDTGDFFVDEGNRVVELTDRGHATVEAELQKLKLLPHGDSLYSPSNLALLQHVTAALKAHYLFKRNVDYMVRNGEVVIIDEHTGRAMIGRRWSDGIHQAVEAKERVKIQQETQTVASTTFQNYFRLYEKLSGMTGTAETEAFEFKQIYGLDVVVVPTHKPMIREDHVDAVYMTLNDKYQAISKDIRQCIDEGRPILVGTASIESSEQISKELEKKGIKHSVLNAKQHEREADIVAQAGKPGTVTIATNMAGRGTDIVLGGNWQAELQKNDIDIDSPQALEIKARWQTVHDNVVDAGGLHIIGTERHESRRIDNQLRGRAGRQGDPGSSRFYLSIEDNLIRLFATPGWLNTIQNIGLEDGEAIESKMVSNGIERAQRKIESRNYDMRKNLLEYDDVSNDQRQIIYQQRDELLAQGDVEAILSEMRMAVVNELISTHLPPESIPEQWDVAGLEGSLRNELGINLPLVQWIRHEELETEIEFRDRIMSRVDDAYEAKQQRWSEKGIDVSAIQNHIMLTALDQKWKEHLLRMDHLRQGIHLRAYAQKQPKQEFKRESFELFQDMLNEIQRVVISTLCRMEAQTNEEARERELKQREDQQQKLKFQHASAQNGRAADGTQAAKQTYKRTEAKIGRNAPCPCGSGKKYKVCCGAT